MAFSGGMLKRRAMIERHLRRVHGGRVGPVQLEREVQRAFASYARYWLESFRLPSTTAAELDAGMSYEGLERIDEALAAGTGAICALPHLGGWDFGGAWLATKGYRITVVVEPVEPPELFEWFASFRRSLGMTIVPLGPDAGRLTLGALKRNEVVGLVTDRDIARTGSPVEFFGETTTLPTGAATLSLRTGAPIFPTAVYFDGPTKHRGVVRPPLDTSRTGRFRDDVARITQSLATGLEALIREAPDQWHLFQPNWPSDPGY
jgi:KDO2-lipid IV(A) lauroyltransferase